MIRTRRALRQTLKACSLSIASSGPGALDASSTLEMDGPEAPTQRKKRSGPKSKTSPYIGVTQYKKTLRWEAHIWIADSSGKGKGGQKHLGSYNTAEEAARCYDRAAIKTRGPTAELNFPYEEYKSDEFMKEHSRLSREPFLKLMREVFALKPASILPHKKARPAAPAKPAPVPRPRPVPLTGVSCLSNSSSPSDTSTQGEPTLHGDLPETPTSWSNGQQHNSGGSRGGCGGAQYFAAPVVKMEVEEAQQQGVLGPRNGSVHSALLHMGADTGEELLSLDHLDDLLLVNPMAQHEEGGLWGGCQLLPPTGQQSAEALALQPLHCPVKQEQQEAGEQHCMMLPAAALVPSGGLLLLEAEREQFSDLLLQPPAAKVPRITSTPAGAQQLLSLELTATAGWATPAAQHFLAQQRSPQPLPLSLSPPPQLSLPPLPQDFFPNTSLGIQTQKSGLRAGQALYSAAAAPTFVHGAGEANPAGQWFSEQPACPTRAWDF